MASTSNEDLNRRLEGCKSLFESIEEIRKKEERNKVIESKEEVMFLFWKMVNVVVKTHVQNALEDLKKQ